MHNLLISVDSNIVHHYKELAIAENLGYVSQRRQALYAHCLYLN